MHFTDEMKLIIERWDVVKDIHAAEDALVRQLRDTLFSLDSKLVKEPWWDSTWRFDRYQDAQSYITNLEWMHENEPLIWIGVENFTVKSIFGEDGFALLYVWVPKEHDRLIAPLRSYIQSVPDRIGDVDTRASSSYIVRQPVRKCLPEELDRFEEVVIEPIIKFMTFYAQRKDDLTETLKSSDSSNGD